MIGYPYINDLFTAIIKQSIVLQGRFYITPLFASEINQAVLSEIVTNYLPSNPKWPAALMIPAPKTGNFQFTGDEVGGTDIGYNYYRIQMLFLRQTQVTQNYQPSQPLQGTLLSQHTIVECWHDMTRCAEDFMQVLRQVLSHNNIFDVIISERVTQSVVPVSNIGNDKLSGCMLSFSLAINGGCDIEDYPGDYLQQITVPALTDTHPTHLD